MPAPGAPPTNPPLGEVSEAALRAIPEFTNPFVNRAGVPDDMDDLGTRCNASWPRAIFEFIVQVNEAFAGRTTPPGFAAIAGKYWRPGDDGVQLVETLDIGAYAIQPPSHLWHLDQTLAAYLGSTAMLSSDGARDLYSIVNARGGVNGEANFIHAGQSFYGAHRYSAANLAGIGAVLAFSCFVQIDRWNETPDGTIIAAHMAYDRATKTGASYRLGFELGLGYASGTATTDELCLYYRHVNGSDVEVVKFPITGGAGRVTLPMGQEFCLSFLRTATDIAIYVNGLVYYASGFGGGNGPSAGTAPEMRLLLGSDWDGSRALYGHLRNVAVWTGAQPNAAGLQNFYRVGSGFSPKGLPV